MPIAYLLCGPSMAGKSTFCSHLSENLGVHIISADALNAHRGLPFGAQGWPEPVWAETLRLQLLALDVHASARQSVAVDDTLCYRWLRDRFRSEADRVGLTNTLLLLRPSEQVIFERHRVATGSASRPVLTLDRLTDHLERFEWPAGEEGAIDLTTADRQTAWLRAERAARAART